MSETAWRKEPPDEPGWWWMMDDYVHPEGMARDPRSVPAPMAVFVCGSTPPPESYVVIKDPRPFATLLQCETCAVETSGLRWQKVEGPKP